MRSIALAMATVATVAMVAPLSTGIARAQSAPSMQLAQVEVDVARPRHRGVVIEERRRRPGVVVEEREYRRRPGVVIEERERRGPSVRIETEGRRYRDW